jgi:hypothetical protein
MYNVIQTMRTAAHIRHSNLVSGMFWLNEDQRSKELGKHRKFVEAVYAPAMNLCS